MQKIKLWLVVGCLYLVSISFWGCGSTKNISEEPESKKTEKEEKKEIYEIALIADLGTIADNSFNKASWEAVEKYALEKGLSYKNYQPEEGTTESYVENIEMAIENGAKLVVCPGYNFETPVYLVQDKYPDVTFILIDGVPYNVARNESKIGENVVSMIFQEEQAGFLAGYAAVKDGYRKLGFMGGMAVPSVIRYGYGYVQGCEAAAKEMEIQVDVSYTYVGTFSESENARNTATNWYQSGVEVIFACGGAIGNSVIEAAEQENAKVIGVDTDQSGDSTTVVTSAMKMITLAVYQEIGEYASGSLSGGAIQCFNVQNDGVGLAMEHSQFRTFSNQDYEKIYKRLVDGEIEVMNQVDIATTADLLLEAVVVDFVH